MSVYSITYRGGHKVAVPVTREEYIAIRNSSRNIANLNMARKGNQIAKRSLVQMNYSCYPNEDGSLKGAQMPSATVGMDIDHIDNLDAVVRNIVQRAEELDIYMVEKTAGGKGLHIAFKRDMEKTNEENIVQMAERLGVEPDLGAKDITRVFFTTTASRNELYLLRDELFEDNRKQTPQHPRGGESVSPQTLQHPEGGESVSPQTPQHPKGGETYPAETLCVPDGPVSDDYLGIPYSKIIKTWWDMFYGGQEPTNLNRNTRTFELAVNLRHICGFSEKQLRHIIPCYDGFPMEERDQCIASAISSKRTMMPKRMTAVIEKLQTENSGDIELVDRMEEDKQNAVRVYVDALPQLPTGTGDAVAVAGRKLTLPTIMAVGSLAGFYATDVKLSVHGRPKGLSIETFIVGESASGKGSITTLFQNWTHKIQDRTDEMFDAEKKWAQESAQKKSGKVDKAPTNMVRIIPFNNTIANLGERLENVKGKHSISFCSESDLVFSRWRACLTDFTVMLRTAYDEDRFDREAKSADAVRVHIPHLLWNTIMCGTQDALYRLITNVTDGFMNRLCLARTPDNTWSAYEEDDRDYSDEQLQSVDFVTEALSLMSGTLHSQMLESWLQEWIETMRVESMKSADRVLARTRFRSPITAMRLTCAAYILPRALDRMVSQYGSREAVIDALTDNRQAWLPFAYDSIDEDTHQFFTCVCDYIVDTCLFYFRDDLTAAYSEARYSKTIEHRSTVKKSSLFDELPSAFKTEDVQDVYVRYTQRTANIRTIANILSMWKKQGLINGRRGCYTKVQST